MKIIKTPDLYVMLSCRVRYNAGRIVELYRWPVLAVVLFLVGPALSMAEQNLTNHPIYHTYQFARPVATVHLGIQPHWLPGNLITEVMRRDVTLMQELANVGLDIRFHGFLKGSDVNFFLLRGDLAAGIGGDMPAISACATGKIRVASLFDLNFTTIVARRQVLLQELAGGRIGYALGSNAHYALMSTLSLLGINQSDIRLLAMDVNHMSEALAHGEIDAFSAWEPTPLIALKTIESAAAISRTLASGYLYFNSAFLVDHTGVAGILVAAQIRALAWLDGSHENFHKGAIWAREASRVLTGQASQLTLEEYVEAVRAGLDNMGNVPIIPADDRSPSGRIATAVVFLKQLGKIPDTTEWSQIQDCFGWDVVINVLEQRERFHLDDVNVQENAP